eukprot:GSChrysophyteH1.ASY1.ANO1.2592.1 assembled CDS
MIETSREFGYVVLVAIGFFLQQQLMFVIPVVMARKSTGISTPTLYPRDSEIKDLRLTDEQVRDYMCKQRAHQNNVEFMSVFMPLYCLAGGAFILFFRTIGGLGYSAGYRKYSGFFHLGELFILYLLGKAAYDMI